MCVRVDRLLDDFVGVEGDKKHKVDERREPGDVEKRADSGRHVRVDRVDANVHPMHERDRAAPRTHGGQRVAGKFVCAPDRDHNCLAQQDIQPDQSRRDRQQEAADPAAYSGEHE